MKLQINPSIVYRIPQLSLTANLEESWEDLKKSIAISSPSFYLLIMDLSYQELLKMDDSYVHTVWKYFNRARYRATPYGSFAGIGVGSLSTSKEAALKVAAGQTLHCFTDWTCKTHVNIPFVQLIETDALFMANSTFYFTEDGMRYIFCHKSVYEIAEVPFNELYLLILNACRKPVKISELFNLLPDEIEKTAFLENMFLDQLLLSEYDPNIIGIDYFNRIGFTSPEPKPDYIIAERRKIEGHISEATFRHLPAMVERLHQLLPAYESPELNQFVSSFQKKFGDNEVKLMVALDPEMGISYGGLDNAMLYSDLIVQMQRAKPKQPDKGISPTLGILLPELINANSPAIDLEKLPLPESQNKYPLPNSIPILCSEANGTLQIEHIGGATANSLLGRFTLGLEEINILCNGIANREQEANPDAVLFDVGYTAENGSVDNVNRRKVIYSHQLNILNYDPNGENSISLDEILASVSGNQLILRSEKTNKRLVPKLATAYNYLLSDLPVFRLLCDLQHQGCHKNFYLKLIDRLPGLSYYPRIQFRNIILSPKTWKIEYSHFKPSLGRDYVMVLTDYFLDNRITGFLRVVKGDQTLTIDTHSAEDLKELWTMLSRNGELYLEETLVSEDGKVVDESGRRYAAQYMVSLHHDQEIYKNIAPLKIDNELHQSQQKFMPGGEWLYFEIFCHQIRTNDILAECVQKLLRLHGARISNWFFIRYNENGHHIRLRLRLHDEKYAQLITASLAAILERKLSLGIVSDISIRTYHREIGRYGSLNIEKVEKHFEADSRYVLQLLNLALSDLDKYKLCWSLINAIERSEVIEKEIWTKLLLSNSKGYLLEHSIGPKQFKSLNKEHQIYSQNSMRLLDSQSTRLFADFCNSFIETLKCYERLQDRCSIFTSLFHMHINRLFQDAQRTHETVVYYFVEREIKKNQTMQHQSMR